MTAWRTLLRKAAALPAGDHPASAFDDVTLGVEAQKKGLAVLIKRELLSISAPRLGRRGGLYRVTAMGYAVANGDFVLVQAPKHLGGGGGGPSKFRQTCLPPTVQLPGR